MSTVKMTVAKGTTYTCGFMAAREVNQSLRLNLEGILKWWTEDGGIGKRGEWENLMRGSGYPVASRTGRKKAPERSRTHRSIGSRTGPRQHQPIDHHLTNHGFLNFYQSTILNFQKPILHFGTSQNPSLTASKTLLPSCCIGRQSRFTFPVIRPAGASRIKLSVIQYLKGSRGRQK